MNRTLVVFILISLFACRQGDPPITQQVHYDEVEQWHSKRVESLKGPNGWLNIAGLFWLQEGMNTFGSAENNDMVFPAEKIGEYAGYFTLKNGVVTIDAGTISDIRIGDSLISHAVVYPPDSSNSLPRMTHGSLLWFVIERDGKHGIRLRDFESDSLVTFRGIERYPVDIKWRVQARLEKSPEGKHIDITNILGQTTPNPSPGTLVFEIDGQEHRLDPILEGGPDFFVIFGDSTNVSETYPAGRYVYVKPPDDEGLTVIDFNKAYNPPCAFTPFATCPLPPSQNVLPVAITAGEKNYGHSIAH